MILYSIYLNDFIMTDRSDIKFYDPQIDIKKKLVDEKLQFVPNTQIPLPSEVEISGTIS